MENASKALIMAASVLLGLMIISVGVALFNTFSDFSKTTVDKLEETKISEWNNNFLKYYGTVSTYDTEKKIYIDKTIEVTAHDIVTVANIAKQNNENYELTVDSSGNPNTYYVQVVVNNKSKMYNNFETLSDSEKNTFLKENSLIEEKDKDGNVIATEVKYYKCKTEPVISEATKRVMRIEFDLY